MRKISLNTSKIFRTILVAFCSFINIIFQILFGVMTIYDINGYAIKLNPLIIYLHTWKILNFEIKSLTYLNTSEKCNIYAT